jgi:MFS family permease
LADRCERRHLLALTYGLNLGNNLLLAGLVITKQASEWPIVVLALVHGILRAVEVPTNQTLLPNLVPRERLLNAVALNQLMQQGARIFGPLCLLPIIRFVNPETAFFLAAGLYATGWWQILRIRTASYGTMVAQQGILGNLVAGLRYIYTEPLVRSLMLLIFPRHQYTLSRNVFAILWRVERPITVVGQFVRQGVMPVEERARAQPASGMTFALLESRRSSAGSTLVRRYCVAILYASWCTRVAWGEQEDGNNPYCDPDCAADRCPSHLAL